MADGDELHVAYNGMQNGSELRKQRRVVRASEVWTELHFEYSALIVLRARGGRGADHELPVADEVD
jgi:hypothetical protein